MLSTDSVVERLHGTGSYARAALAAECADRVLPVYEKGWVGTYYSEVARAVEIGWDYASGAAVDDAEVRSCRAAVEDLVEFYREEGMDVLGHTVTVVLRVLESVSAVEEASRLAVARALASARNVAKFAEAEANQRSPRPSRAKVALAEEEAWQERAFALVEGRQGAVPRGTFDPLGDKPPRWLLDWEARAGR